MKSFEEIFFPTIDSTQTWAKKNASSLSKEKITCILADEQTQGYGRYARKWVSPKGGNLYFTFYFCLASSTPHLSSLAQLACLCLVKVLAAKNLHPQIKWPNDVLLSQKKVSGVLCELSFQPKMVEIFLGVGINVNMEKEFLDRIDQPATSLLQETNKKWNRSLLLQKFEQEFAKNLETFEKKGFTPFLSAFNRFLAYKGEKVVFFDGKEKLEAIVHSLREDGAINLYIPSKNQILSYFSGELMPLENKNLS